MTESSQETQAARRIIERLKMFNRKERDHLMKFALCIRKRRDTCLWKKISNGGKAECRNVHRHGLSPELALRGLATAEMMEGQSK